VVPVLFAYGKYAAEPAFCDKALLWLIELSPEKNTVTKAFSGLAIENTSAFDSQSMLQLYSHYCSAKRCLDCAVGNAILKRV